MQSGASVSWIQSSDLSFNGTVIVCSLLHWLVSNFVQKLDMVTL